LRKVPFAVAAQVTAQTGRPLPEAVVDALVSLSAAVEAGRYARTPSPLPSPTLAALRTQVVEGVRNELSDRPARADGPTALPVGG
jgi:hypothetical protein